MTRENELHWGVPFNPILEPELRTETARMGMWMFLATEILFLGAGIASYGVYLFLYSEGFATASRLTHVGYGTLNTAILLTSSLFVALAVNAVERERRKGAMWLLILTSLFALAFLGVKALEYSSEIREGFLPGRAFHYQGRFARDVELFFYFYFLLTGLHALHIIIGIGLLLGMAFRLRWQPERDLASTVEVVGLYWHFVDIVWVFLYPLLYLVERGGHG